MEDGFNAVYTGESSKYRIFQLVVKNRNLVGSFYVRKELELPEAFEVNLITPSSDSFLWRTGINKLRERARNGSRAKRKLSLAIEKWG
jgi:hypothetical protein